MVRSIFKASCIFGIVSFALISQLTANSADSNNGYSNDQNNNNTYADVDLFGIRIGMKPEEVITAIKSSLGEDIRLSKGFCLAEEIEYRIESGTFAEKNRITNNIIFQEGAQNGSCTTVINFKALETNHHFKELTVIFFEDYDNQPGVSLTQKVSFKETFGSTVPERDPYFHAEEKFGAPTHELEKWPQDVPSLSGSVSYASWIFAFEKTGEVYINYSRSTTNVYEIQMATYPQSIIDRWKHIQESMPKAKPTKF